MKRYSLVIVSILFVLAAPAPALAIPPPDFLFSFGSQFLQFFSIFFVVAAASASAAVRWSRILWTKVQQHKSILFGIGIVAIFVSALSAYGVNTVLRNRAEKDFNAEVELSLKTGINRYDILTEDESKDVIDNSTSDPATHFIEKYYSDIGAGNIAAAYEVSKQNVDYDTYNEWYKNVDSANVELVEQIGERNYSILLSLSENSERTRYAVLMTLDNSETPSKIETSTVQILSTESEKNIIEQTDDGEEYLLQYPDLPLIMTNDEFTRRNTSELYLLDAREDEEFEIGHYPESIHERFADLLAGAWVSLPRDQEIVVICWSAIRGEEVAEFLREKGIAARYLEEGASGWVNAGGEWEGEINFSEVYSDPQYNMTYSSAQVHDFVDDGVLLVDVRDDVFKSTGIAGSINISSIFTPTIELNKLLDTVPSNSTVITVCDDYLSCFDAKLVGIKLEKRGHEFIGRYTEPYDW